MTEQAEDKLEECVCKTPKPGGFLYVRGTYPFYCAICGELVEEPKKEEKQSFWKYVEHLIGGTRLLDGKFTRT